MKKIKCFTRNGCLFLQFLANEKIWLHQEQVDIKDTIKELLIDSR